MKVAGNTLIGHLLDDMAALLTDEVIFVVGYRGDQIRTWIDAHYPHLKTHYVVQEQALGQAHAVALCREFMQQDGEIVVAFGDASVQANFRAFHAAAGNRADAVLTYKEVDDPRPFGVIETDADGFVTGFVEKPVSVENKRAAVGINWFRSSRQLLAAIDRIMQEGRRTKGEFFMADAYQVLLEEGARIRTMPVDEWLDGGSPQNILETNTRLLGLGRGVSQDALERSYGEGFTVVPPVYIHESADIEASVIGPYAHIDEGVTVRGAVIRHSVIDPGATIDDVVLENSLVGEKTIVKGRPTRLFIGDTSTLHT
jgi:glucose-1-phosphate thymidylyltransferase